MTFFSSCGNQKNMLVKEKAINSHINNSFKIYSNIYNELNDIINERANAHIKWYVEKLFRKWQVDSLIVFNKDKTKLYTTLNTITNPLEGGSSDLVQSLYGVKIKGKWHLYLGNQNLIAMRGGYKTNKYEPFTWEELSYVAHEQMFGSYLVFDKNGKFISSPDIVDKLVNPKDVCGRDYINGTEEEGFAKCTIDRNTKKIDSLEYQELVNELKNPTPKEKDFIKKVSWWDNLWGAEERIFDSKEWKEFVADKHKSK